jgi:hypothetical protein
MGKEAIMMMAGMMRMKTMAYQVVGRRSTNFSPITVL